ncbi:MAG: hypothetical protein WCD76_00500, partial [Pyrinomonadaceae bacterium]
MKKILTIAEREFVIVVWQPAYFITLVSLPLIFMLMGAVLTLVAGRAGARQDLKTVGVLDLARVLPELPTPTQTAVAGAQTAVGATQPGDIKYVPYETLETGLHDLHAAHIRALYVLEADYLQTGVVKEYVRSPGLISSGSDPGLPALREALRVTLARGLARGDGAAPEALLG